MRMFRNVLMLLIVLSPISSAYAWWQVNATWQIGGAAPSYRGMGNTKDDALESARLNCQRSQPLEEYRYYCMNPPTRESYSELPGGSYVRSCAKCRVEGNKLVCDSCKPKIERRELDLVQCTGEALNHIENCHGDLTCSACPATTLPKVPAGTAMTHKGACNKEGKNCKQDR